MTFKNSKLHEMVRELPLEKILLETDSPYLAPEPYRGKKNGPWNIPVIAQRIADIKEITLEDVSKITLTNTISFIAVILLIIASGNQREVIKTDNINRTKSLEAIHIVSKYNAILDSNKPLYVSSLAEIEVQGPIGPITFTGTITGYGPDCEGCGGRVGCPPRQDVRDGNIYFNDATYGTIRIVATDPVIPCGTIVKISNFKGLTMDLLFESEKVTAPIGRQYNISYEILRWGW